MIMRILNEQGEVILRVKQDGVKWEATFIDGGFFEDPWTTALIIAIGVNIENCLEDLKSVKIKGWWRNKIPVSTLIWFLTGSNAFWKDANVNWNCNDAEKWWHDRVYEAMTGVETLYDAVIAIRYFQQNDVVQQIGAYIDHLNDIKMNIV